MPARKILRLALAGGLLALILFLGLIFRFFGLGELGGILAIVAVFVGVESGRYVWRMFRKGYGASSSPADRYKD